MVSKVWWGLDIVEIWREVWRFKACCVSLRWVLMCRLTVMECCRGICWLALVHGWIQ